MNKSLKTSPRHYTLGDLVVAVSSASRNSREAAAALDDLFRSRRVCLSSQKRRLRFIP